MPRQTTRECSKLKIWKFLVRTLLPLSLVTSVMAETGGPSVSIAPLLAEPTPTALAQVQSTGEGTLRVLIGKSLVVNSAATLKRVSVTDPAIATAITITPNQVLIHGLAAGSVTLLLWDLQERARPFDLQVELNVSELRGSIQRLLPNENIQVRQSGASLVLTGSISAPEVAERAVALAQTQTQNVVDMLVVEENRQVVLLQVRIAEIERSAVEELGLNLFSTGGANTHGTLTTQQFGNFGANVGAVPANVSRGSDPPGPSLASGGIGNPNRGNPAVFGMSDLLNLFLFRPDLNLGLALRALKQRNLLQILAEPNVLALNGKEASFLAGGEFPFPVVQGGTNFAIAIIFKEFGVRLKFTPTILEDDKIRLKVSPEVSSLDFANSLTISGFVIPAISTRRAETEVELLNGQSFAIAGLIDNRMVEIASKVPVLGDIPFLGKAFRSRSLQKNNSELMVLVTPRLVGGLDPDQVPEVDFPGPFLDTDKFDGRYGEAPNEAGRP